MQLTLTSDQQLMRESIRDFVHSEILPHRMEWDEEQHFPRELFGKMGELGLMGMLVPEQYGGAGLTYYEYKMAIEEIAKVCGSIGLSMAAHNSLCTGHILQFGNEDQKRKWLPKLASGEWIGAWGLTEANTGDAMRMRCVAERDGDHWVLNGTKIDHPRHHRRCGSGLGAHGEFRQPASQRLLWKEERKDFQAAKENKLGMFERNS